MTSTEQTPEKPAEGTVCAWYALCDHPATMFVRHPILGPVPTCTRCAEKHNLVSM